MPKERNEDIVFNVPTKHNGLIEQALEKINNNVELRTLMKVINVNAIDRRGMSDHGPIHFQIVSNIALKLSRMLHKNKIKLSIEEDYELDYTYGELVIFLASFFHDLGMSIDRDGHEEFSIVLAYDFNKQVLDFLPVEERTIVSAEVLHSIISHRSGGTPQTLEAGIVRVADALDMTKGRARAAVEEGNIDIFNISGAAINSIEINQGEEKPIEIVIDMNNSSGLFQVGELLKKKLKGSGLEPYVKVKAEISSETEKKLLQEFVID